MPLDLQVAIHAIGDRANHLILNMYEKAEQRNGARDRRFRIEHAQHLRADDIRRFGALHVIASMQPLHLIDDGLWAEKNESVRNAPRAHMRSVRYWIRARRWLLAPIGMLRHSTWVVEPMWS